MKKEKRKVNLIDWNRKNTETSIEVEWDRYGPVWPKFVIHDQELYTFDNSTVGAAGQYRKEYAVSTLKE